MGQIIGYQGTGALSHTEAILPSVGDTGVAPVLNALQKITQVQIKSTDSGSLLLDVALYDLTASGGDTSTAPRVFYQQDVSFTGVGDPAIDLVSENLSEIDLSAYEGKQLGITANNYRADGVISTGLRNKSEWIPGGTANGSDTVLADPYGGTDGTFDVICLWAETETMPPPPEKKHRYFFPLADKAEV